MRPLEIVLSALIAASFAPAAVAQVPSDSGRKSGTEQLVLGSDAFLNGHPDMKHRLLGQEWYGKQNWTRALEDFRRAARFADKPAQGMLGEMHWNGEGIPMDRATAYAWMDIAAERGYPFLLAKRERYWAEMNAEERERAIEIGEALYAEYGDPTAKPRLERLLRQARRQTTGSRVGSVGALTILIPTPGGMRPIDGSHFYAEKFWKPELYWRWQDNDWKKPATGEVTVGDVLTDANEPTVD